MIEIICGDSREVLKTMPDGVFDCCVTSPPYFGLRDYGCAGQIGLEPTPDQFVSELVTIFREVRRVLRDDGTLWLNLGDSYANDGKWGGSSGGKHAKALHGNTSVGRTKMATGLKPKDLVGIPWMVAFALRADGWYLRQDIIWAKPNPMPESVRDRCTKSHEYIFMLSKSERYYYDQNAIAEPLTSTSIKRLSHPSLDEQEGSARVPNKINGAMKAVFKQDGHGRRHAGFNQRYFGSDKPYDGQSTKDYEGARAQDASAVKSRIVDRILSGEIVTRNKRSVWTVTTKPFKEAHFATFPPDLIEPCILAGSREGGRVLDPFGGAGTTGIVAQQLQRNATLIELNPEYVEIAKRRIEGDRLPLLEEAP